MKAIDLYVTNDEGDELHYKVQVAETDEEQQKGLQGVEDLPVDEGMLFVYDREQPLSFWMKDTLIPLTVAFINKDMSVIAVYDAWPGDETPMQETAMYVLEVNADEDIDEGDDVSFDLDDTKYAFLEKMHVLDEQGNTQMTIKGGERIVSRKQTKVLIRKAKLCNRWRKRSKNKYNAYCRQLGKYIFNVFDRQDERPIDTIDTPE